MNQSPDKVIHYLTGYHSLQQVTLDELQRQADEHPYFPVSQLLLAKKMQAAGNEKFGAQLQKTAISFFNPLWLQYQLMDDYIEVPEVDANHKDLSKEIVGINPKEEDLSNIDNTDQLTVEAAREYSSVVSQPEEEAAVVTRDTDSETDRFLEQLEEAPQTEDTVQTFEPPQVESGPPSLPAEDQEPENVEIDEHERMFQNIKAMLDATSEEADADIQSTVVPIDPYYTIDYFASQGIKLDLDKPQDQLGKQVKKFTQWLKHMKKLGPEDATEVIKRNEADADIQHIADTSNIAREVVTEAMALVLEKQGKRDKAIELYSKLSFLNPHKSAYFAAKINNLKGI